MFTLLTIGFIFGLVGNVVNGDVCGLRNCKAGQVCESDVDGGTCYNRSAREDCSDGISYCYKPRQCCGVSTCCPANSECCGLNTCCPKNSVCCSPNYCCEHGTTCCGFETCCASGSVCEGGVCKSKSGPFRWWYIFFFLAPTFAIIGVIIRRRRRAAMLRAAGVNTGVIVTVPVQTREQYGYDQGPINYSMQPEVGVPPYTPKSTTSPSCPPPPYSDAAPQHA
ncbi:uncharacterized protein LOC132758057 [Ruditapes philippinarum]|uniref:uncharacterized protein LOC132758057 n=1 Tax=Ruditapes philippinarum TaxID=129788 RepID=UPI00295B660D|nr:uncharacterized protein LOC132758057 [Ruditapes philippinarum]